MTGPANCADWAVSSKAPGRIPGRCVGHRIVIDAPPEIVWDFISDFAGWQAWNPLYTRTSGTAEVGRDLHFTVAVPGLRPQKGKARVSAVRPGEVLEYGLSSMAGLVKAQRFVEIEEVSPTRCTVANGEIMGGPAGLLIARAIGEKVAQGLGEMNLALRAIAERKWQGQRA